MWKCQYCEKMNFDDQTICPYCNAPNPAAPKRTNAPAAEGMGSPGNGAPQQPPLNRTNLYNPGDDIAGQKRGKKRGSRVLLWIGAAVAAIIVLTIVFSLPEWKKEAADSSIREAASATGKFHASVKGTLPETGNEVFAATEEPEPEPENEPFDIMAPASLYLDFGETYYCSTDDFVLPYPVDDDEIVWNCDANENGTDCTADGKIVAGNIQVKIEQSYNDVVYVTGTTLNGSTLTYEVMTGDGTVYESGWTDGGRHMKRFFGSVFEISPMVVQCTGFSMYYEYELSDGKIDSDNWSVWVRENGTDWVYIKDITLENLVGDVFDITFDRPITFSEIAVQPETFSNFYEFYPSCAVGYLIFDS